MIPDFQTIMLPLLKLLSDKKDYHIRTITEKLADYFKLTDEEKRELLPSGQQYLFTNRVGWARTYLNKAGLLESPKRAVWRISKRGLDVLEQKPTKINVKFLKQFQEFNEFIKPKKHIVEKPKNAPETPEEVIENTYQELRTSLADELLKKVMELSPTFFERLVIELFVKMGYGGSIKEAGEAIGKSGDEGIDGIIKEDKLGLDIIYVQAKRWQPTSTVSRPEIQKFAGALQGKRAKKGIFIATSSFSKEATEYVKNIDPKIILIDGEQLAQLMIDYDIGVSRGSFYELKKIDTDYFSEE
jgi:restriction system protein